MTGFKLLIVVWYAGVGVQVEMPEKNYTEERCRELAPVVEEIIKTDTGFPVKVTCIPF